MGYLRPDQAARRSGVQGDAVADVAEADAGAEYDADTATLINELKTKVNALLSELRQAGVIASS